ncbi:hypothetical protein PRIPAC_70443 [Pristionchus pacificus]|nr:hypothetical protein PRIPAC_70443 [Pristionchus pacificus]
MVVLLRVLMRAGIAVRRCSGNPSNSGIQKTAQRIKEFFMASEKEIFHPDFVKKAYRFDKIDSKQWMLIYRDETASRTFLIMSISIPIVIISSSFFIWDVTQHQQKDRQEFVQKLVKDAKQLGLFLIVPILGALFVTSLLFRVHSLRVLRIYQKREHPERYTIVAPSNWGTLKKMEFDRDLCISSFIEHENELARVGLLFSFGNMQVDRSRYIVDDDKFRANIYRTYMTNETNIPPRLIEKLV